MSVIKAIMNFEVPGWKVVSVDNEKQEVKFTYYNDKLLTYPYSSH